MLNRIRFLQSSVLLFLLLCLPACYRASPDDGDGNTDGGTDADADTDTDTDADSDSDSDSDGDSDSDNDSDIDADTDGDTDGDTDLEPVCDFEDADYSYPTNCIDEECSDDNPCCDGAICGVELLRLGREEGKFNISSDEEGYITHYCIPSCNTSDSSNPCCETGDSCTTLAAGGEAVHACIAYGEASCDDWAAKVRVEGLEAGFGSSSTSLCKGTLGDHSISVTTAYAGEFLADFDNDGTEEKYVSMGIQNLKTGEMWILQISVPRASWKVGELELGGPGGFAASLLRAEHDGTDIQRIWMEGIATGGTFTITDAGDICEDMSSCERANGSLKIDFAAVKTEVVMDDES
ncbi:MAG: hypothetical protein GY854_22165 [Deltaproteobacteria bacterium]|nr:hypothetical protein [Deltaproteobacteria bacterium]